MEVDYLTVSQLRVSEVYDYVNNKKKQSPNKTKNILFRNILTFTSVLGIEFLILLIGFLVGFNINPILSIIGITSLTIFEIVTYNLLSHIHRIESLLARMHSTKVKVIRQNKTLIIPEEEAEIGDTVLISEGEIVPFDLRIIESNSLVVDESKVFNENRKVGKSAITLPRKEFKIYELSNIVFSNSYVVKGSGKGVIINKKETTHKPYLTITYSKNILYTTSLLLLSIFLSALVFYVIKNISLSLILFATTLFVTSRKYIEMSTLCLKYLISRKLLQQSIVIPSITKIDRYDDVKKSIVKIDQYSFETYIPKFFLVERGKYYSIEDLLMIKSDIPKEFIYCFVISYLMHKKTKNTSLKVMLNPIINILSSIGVHEGIVKSFKMIDYNIVNNINTISTVLLRDEIDISIGIVSLSSYITQFGKPYQTSYNGEGIVILYKDMTKPNASIKPILVIECQNHNSRVKVNDLDKDLKFLFLSELSTKELSNLFQATDIPFSTLSSISADELLSMPEEQRKFLLEKFNLISNISSKNMEYIKEIISKTEETLLECFVEIKQSSIGIMKTPYFGTFFNKGNLILTVTKNFLTPLKLIENIMIFKVSSKKLKTVNILLVVLLIFTNLISFMNGSFIISAISPLIMILLISKFPKYIAEDKSHDNKNFKNKSK